MLSLHSNHWFTTLTQIGKCIEMSTLYFSCSIECSHNLKVWVKVCVVAGVFLTSNTWPLAPVSLAYSNALFLNMTTRIAWSQADLCFFGQNIPVSNCTFCVHFSLPAPLLLTGWRGWWTSWGRRLEQGPWGRWSDWKRQPGKQSHLVTRLIHPTLCKH